MCHHPSTRVDQWAKFLIVIGQLGHQQDSDGDA